MRSVNKRGRDGRDEKAPLDRSKRLSRKGSECDKNRIKRNQPCVNFDILQRFTFALSTMYFCLVLSETQAISTKSVISIPEGESLAARYCCRRGIVARTLHHVGAPNEVFVQPRPRPSVAYGGPFDVEPPGAAAGGFVAADWDSPHL